MLFVHFLPAGGALLVHLSHYHLVFLPPQPCVVFIPGSLFYVCSSSGSICSFAHLTTRPMVAHTNARMHTCVADWPVNRHGQDCFPRTDYWKNTLGFFLLEVPPKFRSVGYLRGSGVFPTEPGIDKLQPALNETGGPQEVAWRNHWAAASRNLFGRGS